MFDLTLDSEGLLQPLTLIVAVVVALTAVLVARRRPDERSVVAALAFVAIVSAALHLHEPHVIRGFVFAFPPILLLIVLRRSDALTVCRDLLAVGVVFAFAVFGTQYTLGGGPEWGWRYFLVAVPLVAPAVARSVVSLWRQGDRSARTAVGAFLVTATLIVASGLLAQRQTMSATAAFLDRTDQVVAETGATQVVFSDDFFGRFNHRLSTEGLVAKVDRTTSRDYLAGLATRAVEPVLLVWPGGGPPPSLPLGPYRPVERTHDLGGIYSGVELVIRR